jgi:hypothetical protein
MSQTGTHSLTLDKLPFAEAYPFIETMMHAHTNESLGRDALPDYTGFCALCDAGALRTYLAMIGDLPIAYCIMYLSTNIIHSDIRQAVQIGVYVKPEFRTGTGRWMIHQIDKDLRQTVDRIYRHERPGSRVGSVYKRLGYRVDETTYVLD